MSERASRCRRSLVAAALALGSAVSLGLARFSYALLLPPMRADLGWSYFTAGAMNTVNAAGYLVGALLAPRVLRARRRARRVPRRHRGDGAGPRRRTALVAGDAALYALRFVTGVGSAAAFVAGGLLAARARRRRRRRRPRPQRPRGRAGLVLGIYYGGTGLGIVVSALLVPPLAERAVPHAWQGGLDRPRRARRCVATAVVARGDARPTPRRAPRPQRPTRARASPGAAFAPALAAYLLFGLGYIGYMTFVVTLLREQRARPAPRSSPSTRCSAPRVVASSWLWARLLQRFRGGEALALAQRAARRRDRCCRC